MKLASMVVATLRKIICACVPWWLVLCAAAAPVRLSWDYDTNSEPVTTNLSFNIYSTTNVQAPVEQWPLLTNVLSTTALDTNTGAFRVDFNLAPAHYSFVAASSNFWGDSSITSNIVQTPPPPQIISSLKIQRLP